MSIDKKTTTPSSNVIFDIYNIVKTISKLKNLTEQGIFSLFNDFFKTTPYEPKSLEETAKIYSDACDTIIKNAVTNEQLTYVSGYFKMTVVNGSQFNCTAELYFKNKNGKWILKTATSESFDYSKLQPAASQRLQAEKTIKFEVTAPSMDGL